MKKVQSLKGMQYKKGFTLIEILLVIGFISGALVLAFVTYPKVQATNRANTTAQHLVTISGGIKNLYSTAKNFSSLSNDTLVNAKVIPDDIQVSGSTINNIWGGELTVAAANGSSGGANLGYTVTLSQVPSSECVKLATGVSANFLEVYVNGTLGAGAPALVHSLITNPPTSIDPGIVATQCNNAANTLVFRGN